VINNVGSVNMSIIFVLFLYFVLFIPFSLQVSFLLEALRADHTASSIHW
jgi:hypothetical protein